MNSTKFINQDGTIEYRTHEGYGSAHRVDGPAFIYPNKISSWYILDVHFIKHEFNSWIERINKLEYLNTLYINRGEKSLIEGINSENL